MNTRIKKKHKKLHGLTYKQYRLLKNKFTLLRFNKSTRNFRIYKLQAYELIPYNDPHYPYKRRPPISIMERSNEEIPQIIATEPTPYQPYKPLILEEDSNEQTNQEET